MGHPVDTSFIERERCKTIHKSFIQRGEPGKVVQNKHNTTQHEHDFCLMAYITEVDRHGFQVKLISIIKHQLNIKFSSSSDEK